MKEYVDDPGGGSGFVEANLVLTVAERDKVILAAARRVLELADPGGAQAGKYIVNVAGAQGVQVGTSAISASSM